MREDPEATIRIIRHSKREYYKAITKGMKTKVHDKCSAEWFRCGVIEGLSCPMGYPEPRRLASSLRRNLESGVATYVLTAIEALDSTLNQDEETKRKLEMVLLNARHHRKSRLL
ncbi:hypothetical protein F441_17442 [Phytophthora nicotianae CJ01A1]|uniref:Uncharacterized protein n=4 Tax=Phytophthora nicotianae TaxID=4792 RepID=W2R1K5_PHYN3|nr:hypothetical protein PPTG_21547 [Phytophthora nicotianae INRA-310]ETK76494.1 hypothetical protein L915_17106 [Phytophthora nicotianae]ETO64990.1 hypothetical protein F444_17615 [Phytophthora nicotianae P1976]ETP06087.1 hypothetical protein F441_17442 [Phytophthora nicotianae CJ01A1]ETL29933.1 hypothetical protein L916_17002 [Phytophthora nicotianae]ETL83162.1 hypothetical protein L917_16830 [Phytophthora nicotianae]